MGAEYTTAGKFGMAIGIAMIIVGIVLIILSGTNKIGGYGYSGILLIIFGALGAGYAHFNEQKITSEGDVPLMTYTTTY